MHLSTRLPAPDPARERRLLDEGWILLDEPRSTAAALLSSAPYMLIAAAITLGIAALFVPVSPCFFGLGEGSFSIQIGLPALLAIAGVTVLHELVHLACIPRTARAGRTSLCTGWAGLFVVCEEEVERNRHLLISIAPFLAISVGGPSPSGRSVSFPPSCSPSSPSTLSSPRSTFSPHQPCSGRCRKAR